MNTDELEQLRAENKALHTKLAQFTKWNSQLTAKCNWYNCDGARLEREIESLKQQVEQGKRDAVPEDIRKDAERYLWLKSQKGLNLSSCGGSWIKGNIKFNASHRLCANDTAYAPYETLDEAIDAAIAAAPKQEK